MREALVTTETWVFDCQRCRHLWSQEYEVWHTCDFSGGEVIAWRRFGLPCLPPSAGTVCPYCGGLRVKLRPWRTAPHDVRLVDESAAGTERRGAARRAAASRTDSTTESPTNGSAGST